MSYSLSLHVMLDSNNLLYCKEIINHLLNAGWIIEKNSKITYLPLNDNDMFEWTTSEAVLSDFIKLVDEKEHLKEIVGVELYWENTDIGGHLLLFNSKDFSFELNINTRFIGESLRVPDFSWYAERIIPYLSQEYHIIEYNFVFS